MPLRQQVLIDKIAAVVPLAQRILVTSRQQAVDTTALLAAITAARDALASLTHLPPTPGERPVRSLELAITRSGRAVAEVAHLCGIREERLRHLIANGPPTRDERTALMTILRDWLPDAELSVARPVGGDPVGRHL